MSAASANVSKSRSAARRCQAVSRLHLSMWIRCGGPLMKQIAGIAIAVLALAGAPVFGQSGQSGQAKSPATSATMKPAGSPDQAFAKEAAIGGMAEVELGNLAKQNASSPDVIQFADRMVTDHGKANDELKQWASQNSVTLPTELDAKHKATR